MSGEGEAFLTFDSRDVEEAGHVVPEEDHERMWLVVYRVVGVRLADATRAEHPVTSALVHWRERGGRDELVLTNTHLHTEWGDLHEAKEIDSQVMVSFTEMGINDNTQTWNFIPHPDLQRAAIFFIFFCT